MMLDEQMIAEGIKLAIAIHPLLTGHRAEVVDFALAQSLAALLVGYHPDVRQRMLANHVLRARNAASDWDQLRLMTEIAKTFLRSPPLLADLRPLNCGIDRKARAGDMQAGDMKHVKQNQNCAFGCGCS